MSRANCVWVSPNATSFSCLCEECLELARTQGSSFVDAVRQASVRGKLPAETDVGFASCSAGHQVIVRRVDRPPELRRHDDRQLQLA